ncbi:Dbt1p [Parelaphostrongylus tenuis]|uniref:Dihydrolipoamide acetyltransferase component of pyruvate dehydrogenase complex n=1 Tax=Parelaphostrongylus tenuis TaxID=148309 RepID=A0AAD5ME36_PARTN|nr:Dbt1p [Parelaphostrongylus tenuis]
MSIKKRSNGESLFKPLTLGFLSVPAMFVAARFLRLPRTCLSLSTAHSIHFSGAISLPTIQFKLSDIGEGIAEVQIKEWYVKVGDKVSQFDSLCEVQSDKAAVTITSRYDGVIKKLLFNVDDMARVGEPLVEIDVVDAPKDVDGASSQPQKLVDERSSGRASSPSPTTSSAGNSIIQFRLTDIGEGIAEVQLKEWYVKVGDKVSEFDNLCEVQSDKATVTITSRYEGIIRKLLHNVDEVIRVGQPLLEIEVAGTVDGKEAVSLNQTEPSKPVPPSEGITASEHRDDIASGKVLATPAVRRIAMENKIDLKKVKGSGRDGRVLKEDVLQFLGQVREDHSPIPTHVRAPPTVSTRSPSKLSPLSKDRLVPLRGYTRTMIKTMTEALKIPHFGYDDEVRADALIEVRRELQEFAKERGVKLSFMPFFIKAASLALTEFPSINASIDEKFENFIYKASHNICLAMDTPGGLVVPNIKHCEQRSIFEIASELQRLHEDGKREKIAQEDLIGGTFTISNIGSIGGTYASPVIFPPQVAIGALGRIQKLPRYDSSDNLVPMYIFKVSWAADHRVVDGATIARFSNRWKYYVEHPSAMLTLLK